MLSHGLSAQLVSAIKLFRLDAQFTQLKIVDNYRPLDNAKQLSCIRSNMHRNEVQVCLTCF
jgi:hypothetical protein